MHLIEALSDLCKSTPQPIISIDGPAGAGKTTLAHDLASTLDLTVRVIHMDDLYDGWDNALSDHLTQTLLTLIKGHKSKASLEFHKYDWRLHQFNEAVALEARDLLILEGVGSGQKAVREYLAALIWMEIEPQSGFERVLARDGREIETPMRQWLKAQDGHFVLHSTHEAADFVITT